MKPSKRSFTSSSCSKPSIVAGSPISIIIRGRFDFPTLRTKVLEHAKQHKASRILIEDAGFGTALIQELKSAHFSVIPVKPEYDKKIRMLIQSAKFESGRVFFPKEAPWLADLEAELWYKSPSSWTSASLRAHPGSLDS